MAAVRVVKAQQFSPDTVRDVLGVEPLAVAAIEAPSLLVDGEFHNAGCRWLMRKHALRPVESTVIAHATRLGRWIQWLRAERHLVGDDWMSSDVFLAREDDLLDYYRLRQYSTDRQVSSATWRAQLSTIKQFHQWLAKTFGVPLPFTTKTFTLPNGTTVTAVDGMRPRRRPSSAGTPLTPGFAELLIQGALRIDADGHQHDVRTAERDGAFVSLGLGTGMRLSTLASLTHYEVPRPERGSVFTAVAIPDFITKGDAGGEAIGFSHRLRSAQHYIEGDRAELSARAAAHRPADPLHIVTADEHTWTCEVDGKTIVRRWAETDARTRRRLIDVDGRSPLLWLDPRGGTPIGYDTCERITSRAASWTHQHIHPGFPPRIHTHDLRHTYATHLTVCIFKRALQDVVTAETQSAYAPTRLTDAVEMAKMSLGHASDQSTQLYTRHAHKMLDIPLDDFLGRF